MAMRNYLCVGDPPVTGGAVLPYPPPDHTMDVHGVPVAIIGGKVRCNACKSIGIIAKSGGSRRCGFFEGVALDGDVCLCRCHPPPPIKATHALTVWYEDDGDAMMQESEKAREYNQHFLVVDEKTGKPLKNRPYKVSFNGQSIEGKTDENGKTQLFHYHSSDEIIIEV